MKKISIIFMLVLLSQLTNAASVSYSQDKKTDYSKVIEINSEKFVELPDGRRLPFGSGVVCSDECPEIATGSNKHWLWLAIPAGLATALLWPGRTPQKPPSFTPSPIPTPRREVPPRREAPPVEVPEPSTFGLAAVGLALFKRRGRMVALTLLFLALPVIAGTTIRINPTAIDGNFDSRDDFWRVRGNIGTPDALYIPPVLIPPDWIRPAYARWVSNNNGGGAQETFSRQFVLPGNTDLASAEAGIDFSTSGPCDVFVNGVFAKTFIDSGPTRRTYFQARDVFRPGANLIEIKVYGVEKRLLGFLCLDGYVNFSTVPDTGRTLKEFRRKGRAS